MWKESHTCWILGPKVRGLLQSQLMVNSFWYANIPSTTLQLPQTYPNTGRMANAPPSTILSTAWTQCCSCSTEDFLWNFQLKFPRLALPYHSNTDVVVFQFYSPVCSKIEIEMEDTLPAPLDLDVSFLHMFHVFPRNIFAYFLRGFGKMLLQPISLTAVFLRNLNHCSDCNGSII